MSNNYTRHEIFRFTSAYYPAESLSWYSEALSKHAWMPESFHKRKMMSDISLGMVPSSMVSARCMSFLASSCSKKSNKSSGWRFSSKLRLFQPEVEMCRYLLIRVAIVNIECVHGLHDGHDGLQSVAVDDGDKLQAFFKWVTIFVNNSAEKK